MQLFRTFNGEIINLDSVFGVGFNEGANITFAYSRDLTLKIKVADGNILDQLWNGRRDFMEVNIDG